MTIEEIVNEVLKGIDETESDSPDGWWPTSTGAKFGKETKAELIEKITEYVNSTRTQ